MPQMTLRAAADRTARSITTLRRYIRSGRLKAGKRPGRFGPEYFVSEADLEEAGLESTSEETSSLPVPVGTPTVALERVLRESVPIGLFQELQMKHEQLLVQYGMVRAGGLRVLELQAEADARRKEIEGCHTEITRLKERLSKDASVVGRQLREAELELEGRHLEIAALREKVRALELLTRNAVTTETIERQFVQVMEQANRVDRMRAEQESDSARPGPRPPEREVGPEH